ncbi:hypothetical protein GBAR_LOCUS19420 [Geodia barretti]|uniref:Transmembrane protein n=1 Tax=Geodia barretti TaxID=519541 RepID=A0AA35ST57_GEOBA|nr:hypothetical protein GBAR_LOCUS19420 [Geodia barretti]
MYNIGVEDPGEQAVLPTYDEALYMTRLSGPSTSIQPPVHRASGTVRYSRGTTVQPVHYTPGTIVGHYHGGRRESEERVYLQSLTSPEPPSYPYNDSPPVMEQATPSSSPGQRLTNTPGSRVPLKEPVCFCCYTGMGGLRMPPIMIATWKIGMRRIMSTGDIGGWARYIFLAVQSLLLLAGIIISFATPFDNQFLRYLGIGFLAFALTVISVERFIFWCGHGLSDLRRGRSWNLCADIVRLFITEILIYGALMTTLSSRFDLLEESSSTYSIVGLIGLLYFLTAVVMKMFIVIKFTWSLLKSRAANRSNAATSQKCLLYGLCINTGALILLQTWLVVYVGSLLQTGFSHEGLPLATHIIFSGLVSPYLWGLYFLNVSPFARLFPLSMALDLPPTHNCPDPIDVQTLLPLFETMHRGSKTISGFTVNVARLYTSPLFVLTQLLYVVMWSFMVAYMVSDHSTSPFSRYFAFGLLVLLSLPSLLYGLFVVILTPCSLCMSPILLNYNEMQYWSVTTTSTVL